MRAATTICEAPPLARTRAADYLELTKPRIAVAVLFTVAVGYLSAAGGSPDLAALLHTLCGTALVAGGASALNQLLERHSDALMRRTENRPLPAGRLHPFEVLVFGMILGAAGLLYLAVSLHHPWAALVAGITFVSYVFLYTPLKRLTPLNTLVGAVPGALPPVIGWAAARGSAPVEATSLYEVLTLFLIVFLWQVPHFLVIAWIYRDDYARAGLCMLPVNDPDGALTGRYMITYCLALIPVSLVPALLGVTGLVYLVGALALGLGFLACAVHFTRTHSTKNARRVLRASLIYLPALLTLLLLNGIAKG